MAHIKKNVQAKKQNKNILIGAGIVVLLVVLVLVVKGGSGGKDTATASGGENLLIPKSEVTETAAFYPYKAGNVKMEVLAVKAPDGTIRTAFNTCQVCYDSGRGYYVQEGDELVCQNCGNRFKTSDVEKVRGGCNPVPILEKDKTDDGTNLVVSGDYLAQNKGLFGNWKKG